MKTKKMYCYLHCTKETKPIKDFAIKLNLFEKLIGVIVDGKVVEPETKFVLGGTAVILPEMMAKNIIVITGDKVFNVVNPHGPNDIVEVRVIDGNEVNEDEANEALCAINDDAKDIIARRYAELNAA